MADIKKGTKRKGENMDVEDGSETMLKRPNFVEAKPENIKQARSKRAIYIPSNRLLYVLYIYLYQLCLELYAYR